MVQQLGTHAGGRGSDQSRQQHVEHAEHHGRGQHAERGAQSTRQRHWRQRSRVRHSEVLCTLLGYTRDRKVGVVRIARRPRSTPEEVRRAALRVRLPHRRHLLEHSVEQP